MEHYDLIKYYLPVMSQASVLCSINLLRVAAIWCSCIGLFNTRGSSSIQAQWCGGAMVVVVIVKQRKLKFWNAIQTKIELGLMSSISAIVQYLTVKSKFYFNVQTKPKSVIFVWKLNFLSYSLQTGTKKAICLQITMCVWKLNILECHFSQYLTLFSLQLENNTSA